MEFLALIGLGIFGVMFIGGIMGIVANARVGKLEQQVRRLQNQLRGAPDIDFTPSMRPDSMQPEPLLKPKPKPKPEPEAERKPEPVIAEAVHKPTVKQDRPVRKPRPQKTKRTFEEEIGARWAVWVGGIALAFGAIFLLRYTIEAGVFSPAMRIVLAALMGAVLLAAGEYLRRVDGKDIKLPEAFSGLKQTAYIPGVLTGVGIFTLLGTVYAAYELYNFIGPLVTFALLAAISMAALALSLLHGSKMAALGLVASLVTPLLIDMGTPNYFILYTYLIAVSIAALALAWRRDWPWLNVLTLFGALAWSFISVEATEGHITYGAWLIYTGFLFALSTYIAHNHDKTHTNDKQTKGLRHNYISANIWAGIMAVLMIVSTWDYNDLRELHTYMALGFGFLLMGIGWFIPRQNANSIIGGICAGLTIWIGADSQFGTSLSLALGVLCAATVITLSFLNARKSDNHPRQALWSGFGVAWPLIIFLYLYDMLNPPEIICKSGPTGCEPVPPSMFPQLISVIFITLAVASAAQSWLLWRKQNDISVATPIYAMGAAIAYTLAVLIGFSGITESILLMMGIVISAAIYNRIAIPALRWTAAGFALLSAAHTLFVRIGEDGALSERIILNELWIYFALPAVLCAGAAWILSRKYNDIWSEGLKALTLTFAALFFVFQIRHFMNGGNILSTEFGFDEMALQVMVGLSFTLGGTLLGRPDTLSDSKRKPYERLIPGLATAVSVVTLVMFVFGICFAYNPLLSSDTVIKGGTIINSLVLAYLMPALALAAITWLSRGHRSRVYVQVTGALSLVAFMLYLTSTVRVLFAGSKISIWAISFKDAELYAISAVWLAFGIALLVAGLKFKQKDTRMASALVITLTVLKAFLIDMASLEGVLRAMSFVVLGLALIVIGRVYQKLLFSKSTEQ